MPWMNFDLQDGKPPVGFDLKADDCDRFVQFMAECDELRAEVESLTHQLKVGESFHAVTVQQRDAAWREAEALRAEVESLRADAATDRKLVQAAEKFIHPVLQELQFERGHGSLAVHNLRLVLIEAMKANAKHAEIDAARAAQEGQT